MLPYAMRATLVGTLALAATAAIVLAIRPHRDAVRVPAFHDLDRAAQDAFDAGQLDEAELYASVLLDEARAWQRDWDYGNAIHKGHTVLGLVAEARGDRRRAVDELARSAETPGSPQLDSFGPNMLLARVLLADGEPAVVLAYFDRCRAFWNDPKLAIWADDVRAHRMPEFGANLLY